MTGQERGPDPKALQPRSSALLEFATSTSGCTDLNWRGSVALAHAQHVRARVSGWDSLCGGRDRTRHRGGVRYEHRACRRRAHSLGDVEVSVGVDAMVAIDCREDEVLVVGASGRRWGGGITRRERNQALGVKGRPLARAAWRYLRHDCRAWLRAGAPGGQYSTRPRVEKTKRVRAPYS